MEACPVRRQDRRNGRRRPRRRGGVRRATARARLSHLSRCHRRAWPRGRPRFDDPSMTNPPGSPPAGAVVRHVGVPETVRAGRGRAAARAGRVSSMGSRRHRHPSLCERRRRAHLLEVARSSAAEARQALGIGPKPASAPLFSDLEVARHYAVGLQLSHDFQSAQAVEELKRAAALAPADPGCSSRSPNTYSYLLQEEQARAASGAATSPQSQSSSTRRARSPSARRRWRSRAATTWRPRSRSTRPDTRLRSARRKPRLRRALR